MLTLRNAGVFYANDGSDDGDAFVLLCEYLLRLQPGCQPEECPKTFLRFLWLSTWFFSSLFSCLVVVK